MLSSIQQITDRQGLDWPQKRFIFDNLQILQCRQETNFIAATKQIRNLIKNNLDQYIFYY